MSSLIGGFSAVTIALAILLGLLGIFAAMALIFAALNVVEWKVSFGVWRIDPFWLGALGFGVVIAIVLRLVRRHTTLLAKPTT